MTAGMHANRRNRGADDEKPRPCKGCYIWEGIEDRTECPICGSIIMHIFERICKNCPIPYCKDDYTKAEKLSTLAQRLAARNSPPETQEP